jgi:hypothetical protein
MRSQANGSKEEGHTDLLGTIEDI